MSSTFIDQVLAGEILNPEGAINDAIDRWHEDGSETRPLHDVLGMTWEEYSLWAESPESLPTILFSRKFGIPLRSIAAANGPETSDLAIAARSAKELSKDQRDALRAWLDRHNLA